MDEKKIEIEEDKVEELGETLTEEREEDQKTPLSEEEKVEEKDQYKDKYEDLYSKFLRLQADFTNYKRRSQEEKSNYVNLGVEKLALDILPVLDNFNRALDMVEEKDSNIYQGMEMLAKQFVEILDKNDIKEMDAEGKEFDPNFHHAVFMESVEGVDAGKITCVLQKGYFHGDKVIRPAMVKVSE